jgi:hypothetical protein
VFGVGTSELGDSTPDFRHKEATTGHESSLRLRLGRARSIG